MADLPPSPASAVKAPCGQCTKCLNDSGEMVELFPGLFRPVAGTRMVLCVICGNKRCPHAADCALVCTNSNEPGQPGSNYASQVPFKADGSGPKTPVKEVVSAEELARQSLALYTAPFRAVNGAIFDAADHKVADDREGVMRVRGWGRIGYMQDGSELQDAVGLTLAAALNDYWRAHATPVEGQPFVERRRLLTPAEASFEALGVDTSDEAAKEAEHKAVRIERDALRAKVAELEGAVPVLTEILPGATASAPKMPHPNCDEACYYHCTEGGTRPPSCIAIAAGQDKEAAEAALAGANAEGLPPPDYYMSSQHGKLLLEYTGQPDDCAYRWQGVWLSPTYEQNAMVRQKAAQYADLVDRLVGSRFATPGEALHAAMQAANLSDAVIAGVCGRYGMASIPEHQQVKAVREVLRNAGIESAR